MACDRARRLLVEYPSPDPDASMAVLDVVKVDWTTDLVESCWIRLPILLLTSSRRRGMSSIENVERIY